MYANVQGRFLSRDPMPADGIDVLYEHPFAYARNTPISLTDASGLFPPNRCIKFSDPTPPPRHCGPDVTAWFKADITVFRREVESLLRAFRPSIFDDHIERRVTNLARSLESVFLLQRLGPLASYKTRDFRTSACSYICIQPDRTQAVGLCGKCVWSNQLGNIVFGIVAEDLDLVEMARAVGHGAYRPRAGPTIPWTAPGQAYKETAFDIGVAFARKGGDLCAFVKLPSANPIDGFGASDCAACSHTYSGTQTDLTKPPPGIDETGNIIPRPTK